MRQFSQASISLSGTLNLQVDSPIFLKVPLIVRCSVNVVYRERPQFGLQHREGGLEKSNGNRADENTDWPKRTHASKNAQKRQQRMKL